MGKKNSVRRARLLEGLGLARITDVQSAPAETFFVTGRRLPPTRFYSSTGWLTKPIPLSARER